jgi:uncharacterized membrane protein HdeD (DUF308 family)
VTKIYPEKISGLTGFIIFEQNCTEMELKSYDKPWLPAFKGVFLIIFGIVAMLQIAGTIKSLAVMFIFLIAMIGILLIFTGIRYKNSQYRIWTIISGIIHLAFVIYLSTRIETADTLNAAREGVATLIIVWLVFYAITEVVEAVILISLRNAFATLFLINALLTLLFGYFLYVVSGNFTSQGVFHLGLIAIIFGIVNELSAYLLSRIKS